MLVNICMKFHEGILKSFWVTERTWPYRKIYYFQFQMAISPKIRNPELWFLRSACCPMLLYICVKFHENIANGFGVTERTQFCLRNCYLQSSKGHNSKSINIRVIWFLGSAHRLMLVNICMKFHEGILNGFWVTERTWPYRKIYYFQFQRAVTPKIRNPELRFLRSARCVMLLYICVKFHENISNGFGVTEQTRFCDRQIDDQGKNKMFPNPTGGDIMNSLFNKYYFLKQSWSEGTKFEFFFIIWTIQDSEHSFLR